MNSFVCIILKRKLLILVIISIILLLSSCGSPTDLKNNGKNNYGLQHLDEKENEVNDTINTDLLIEYVTGELIYKYKPSKIIDVSSKFNLDDAMLIMISSKSDIFNMNIHRIDRSKGVFKTDEIVYIKEKLDRDEKLFLKIDTEDKTDLLGISYINEMGEVEKIFFFENNSKDRIITCRYK